MPCPQEILTDNNGAMVEFRGKLNNLGEKPLSSATLFTANFT
jgi:hypothetical protein